MRARWSTARWVATLALASLLLGVTESAANTFMSSSASDMLLFGLVMLMLIFRPAGLLGQRER